MISGRRAGCVGACGTARLAKHRHRRSLGGTAGPAALAMARRRRPEERARPSPAGAPQMNDREQRPDPDALLRRLEAEETQRTRAKLKIFLGYAPGFGKTYKMLELACELFVQKVDIVIGYVELHRRYDTNALWLGLDFLPRRSVVYRGTRLDEF